ncbi:metallophosphoesterase family protein [Polymorphobacter sp.]|uniref:metallophosphoesterase family protein n=1 Tax=Polymorphobacter sp. TaxID=1909290 RepID=UPI003F726286
MIRLFHASDIHFGAADPEALDWFLARTHAEQPDAVIITGDLTMRARSHEFAAATAWLQSLGRPVSVAVGNHDLPYFNPWSRLVRPYRRHERLARTVSQPLQIPGLGIVPLKTTARAQLRLNWSKGKVSTAALDQSLAQINQTPPGHTILVIAHHPLVEADTRTTSRTRNGPRALAALAAAGVDAVLTGHVHDPFDVAHSSGVRLIGAGTLSERVRLAPPSFNEIRLSSGRIEVIAHRLGARDVRL